MERLWTKDFIIITFVNLFLFIAFQMLIPTLPKYVIEIGGSEKSVGLIIGFFTISAVLIRPFIGSAMDKHGRKIIFLLGLVIFILVSFSYTFAKTIIILLILRLIHGLGWGATTTASGTIAADIIPQKRRGEGMGYYGLSTNIAVAIAPAIGLWIIENNNFMLLFVTSGILAIISLILATKIKGNYDYTESNDQTSNKAVSLFEKSAILPTLLIYFIGLSYSGIVSFITLFAEEKQISGVGYYFTFYAIAVILTRPLAGKVYDKRGHAWVMIPGTLLLITALILLSRANSLSSLLMAGVFYGFGFGTVQPTLQAWIISRSPVNKRGAANAMFFSGFDLGIGSGAFFLGVIAEKLGYSQMYLFSSLFVLTTLTIYLIALIKQRRQEKQLHKS